MGETIKSGGLTFDSEALDALLDDAPTVTVGSQDADANDVEEVLEESEGEVSADEGDSSESEDSTGEAAEAETEDEVDEGSDDRPDEDLETVEPEGDFIADGDEGPMLMTGANEDGSPVYESADELFGDHTFKIKAAGQEHEVTFAEMRKGYQRQADYTQAKTKISETQRAMQPYIGLLAYFEKDSGLRETISNYIDGVKSSEVSNDDILAASDDPDKLKAVLEKRDKAQARKNALKAANTAAAQQQQQLAAEQHEIAKSLIPDYNDNVTKVKSFLTNLGYGEHEVQGLEYMDARLQNIAYLAYKQANPSSAQTTTQKPGKKALQAKRKRIVRRPPKAVKAASGQTNTPKSRSSRKAQAAFKRAYQTQDSKDFVSAIATVLPDSLLDD